MSQRSVYKFLKRNKNEFFSVNQIAKELNISSGNVFTNISRLVKYKNIETGLIISERNNTKCKGYRYVER